jgi:hypothetical protein
MSNFAFYLEPVKNKEATYADPGEFDLGCQFISAEGDGDSEFCRAPVVGSSAYCDPHRALCALHPGTDDTGAPTLEAEIEAGAEPPEELRFLAAVPVPDPIEDFEREAADREEIDAVLAARSRFDLPDLD